MTKLMKNKKLVLAGVALIAALIDQFVGTDLLPVVLSALVGG